MIEYKEQHDYILSTNLKFEQVNNKEVNVIFTIHGSEYDFKVPIEVFDRIAKNTNEQQPYIRVKTVTREKYFFPVNINDNEYLFIDFASGINISKSSFKGELNKDNKLLIHYFNTVLNSNCELFFENAKISNNFFDNVFLETDSYYKKVSITKAGKILKQKNLKNHKIIEVLYKNGEKIQFFPVKTNIFNLDEYAFIEITTKNRLSDNTFKRNLNDVADLREYFLYELGSDISKVSIINDFNIDKYFNDAYGLMHCKMLGKINVLVDKKGKIKMIVG